MSWQETEFGKVPSDWGYEPLENYLDLITYGFTNPMPTTPTGVYMVTAKEIFNGRLNLQIARFTSEEAYSELLTDKSRPIKDDVLITKDGSIGRVAIVGNEKICISQSVALMRPAKDRISPIFLKYLLESKQYQALIDIDATGSTIQHIYITKINKMKIAVPTLSEQQAIASALSSLDDKIDLLHRQNKTLEAMAETLFRQWFIEEAKENWGEIPFGNLIELHDSKRVPLSQLQRDAKRVGTLYPYYGASGVIDQINGYIFDGNYLLLSEDGENLRTRKTPIAFEAHGKFWVNNHAHVMQAIKPFTNGFVRILLEGENLDSIITGAVQPKINQANLLSYKVPNFPHVLVEKYVDISEPWFNKVLSNNEQIQTLENLRDTLLPKLMSGEVRVHYQTEEVA